MLRSRNGYGRAYLVIERALWALGPALLLLIALSYPSQQAARQQIAANQAIEIAAEDADIARIGECRRGAPITRAV